MAEKKKIKYEDAIHELETIVNKMDSGELDVDSMTDQLKRAQELIKLCKTRLTETDKEINKLLKEDK